MPKNEGLKDEDDGAVKTYRRAAKADIGNSMAEGEYTVNDIEFKYSENFGEFVVIHTPKGIYHSFSKVLYKQFDELAKDKDLELPVKIKVSLVKGKRFSYLSMD